jgi:hypothetical protein
MRTLVSPRLPQAEVVERMSVVKQMVQIAMLPALRERWPDAPDANLMEMLSGVALSAVHSYGGTAFTLDMLRVQVASVERIAEEEARQHAAPEQKQ